VVVLQGITELQELQIREVEVEVEVRTAAQEALEDLEL
jgi:hypothetical protein